MIKKHKNIKNKPDNQQNEIIKKVKSLLLDAIVRDWLSTPCKELSGKTPLQLIKNGEGQKILDAIKQMENENQSKLFNTKPTVETSIDEGSKEEGYHSIHEII